MHDLATLAPRLFALALAAAPLSAQLAGTYTINPAAPPSPTSFSSLATAVAALTAQGVGGPVEFLLYDDAGPYTEQSSFATGSVFGGNTAVLVLASWSGASMGNRVTFRPAPGEHVVFDATGRSMGVFWGGADYVTLRGIEIANAIFDGISLYAEAAQGIASDPIIDGCRIHDCGGPAVTIYGNTPQPANTLVQNCVMWRCQVVGGGPFATTGRFGYVCTRRTNGTRIVHNTFFVDTLTNNASYGVIASYPNSATELPYAEVSNNIVVKLAGPVAPLFRINSFAGSSFPVPPVCDSNCFLNASGSPFAIYGSPATTAATLLDWQTGASCDLNSIEADPLFRDATAHDFHLTAPPGGPSPCIGASTVVANVARDADGQPRSTPADIGADEFGASEFTAVGGGCPGTGGLAPTLQLYAWPFLGGTLELGFERMPPGTFAFLFGSLGVSPVPLPIGGGCDAWLALGSLAGLAATVSGPVGTGSIVYPVPAIAAFVGFEIAYQGIVLDGGAPLGLTVTNALDVVFDF